MVDIQSISITLAALSFIVAATYYALNLTEIRRSRRITLTTTVMQPFMTVEGNQPIMDLITMEWSDLDDFKTKYDHMVNPKNFINRIAVWRMFDSIGLLYRKGLLDLETIESGSTMIIENMWRKFKPIIEMYRETDYHKTAWQNWEYLAEKLAEAYPESVPYDGSQLYMKEP